jgi:SAM-dependent methyltransferase
MKELPMSISKTVGTGSAEIQAALWGRGARDWADHTEPLTSILFEEAFNDVGIGPGTRLLDIGCGSGLAARLANERGASVTGLDATPEMLAIAHERVPGVMFQQGDMESLPYPDDAFDVVTGFNSFQYAASPHDALFEASRVCRPGGSIVIAAWGRPEHCDSVAIIKTLGSFLPPPPPGTPGPFALSADGALAALARDTGLEPLRERFVTSKWDFPDLDSVLRSVLAVGPATRAIEIAGLDRIHAALADAHAPFRDDDGHYRMSNEFIYLIARA